jgi:hypothetical protein
MYVFVFVQYQMEDNINDSIGMALTSCLVPIHVEDGNNPATPSPINVQSPAPSLPTRDKKSKRKNINQSMAWDHFTKVEPIDFNNPKAKCNYCLRQFGCHRRLGTSAMLSHLHFGCKKSPIKRQRLEKNQTSLQLGLKQGADGNVSSQIGFMKYDPDRVRMSIVQYLIKCGLPFKHVDTEGFQEFVSNLEPRFTMPSRDTIQRDCMNLYRDEKQKLKDLLSGQRICLTIDTWTSLQNLNYVCLTAHYIDCNWELHKKILNFCLVPNHRGETIGIMLETALLEWGVDKVFTITVDNASSNDITIDYIRRKIKDKDCTVLGGEFLHMRCTAYILNLIVTDALNDVHDSITNVRNAVRYVKSSSARLSKFKECVERGKIQSKKMVCLDVCTIWNSTYLMLSTAEKFQRAFELMGKEDNQLPIPGYLDWKNARILVKFLKIFYDVTLSLSSSLYVTSNMYFQQLCIIQNTLNDMCVSDDPIMSAMAANMKIKYDKYWGSIDRINLMLYVAFVLDPRFKMKALVFWLKRCNGKEWSDNIEAKVRHLMNRLIEQYNMFHGDTSRVFDVAQGNLNATSLNIIDDDSGRATDKFTSLFTQHLEEENGLEYRSEVDRYLLDGCEASTPQFDVLAWWKMNSIKYPILAEIARDVLAIPISTIASESLFSTGRHIFDSFKSSLSPLTVQALICTQNWLRSKPIDIQELEELVKSDDDDQGKRKLVET